MNIIINEQQELIFEKEVVNDMMREKIKRVESEKAELEDFIESNGEFMVDVTNGKKYLVQYLRALSELVGKQYAMCAPVRKDGTYGAFYVKPFETFKKTYGVSGNLEYNNDGNGVPQHIKPNLYQTMGLNK